MEVFRISAEKHAKALTASGKASRWNKDNQFVIYAGEMRSLAVLESVVHKSIGTALNYEIMIISIADQESLITRLQQKKLPKNWRDYSAYSDLQEIGSDWYRNKKSLVLQVPSVIIPQEYNFIINTNHPDFNPGTVSLVRNEPFLPDSRLF